jgi:hypothetical protein
LQHGSDTGASLSGCSWIRSRQPNKLNFEIEWLAVLLYILKALGFILSSEASSYDQISLWFSVVAWNASISHSRIVFIILPVDVSDLCTWESLNKQIGRFHCNTEFWSLSLFASDDSLWTFSYLENLGISHLFIMMNWLRIQTLFTSCCSFLDTHWEKLVQCCLSAFLNCLLVLPYLTLLHLMSVI